MKKFTQLYADKLIGVLSGFDRLIFRGYLRELSFVRGLFMCTHRVVVAASQAACAPLASLRARLPRSQTRRFGVAAGT